MILLSILLYLVFQYAPKEDNYIFLENQCALAYMIFGILGFILLRKEPIKQRLAEISIGFIFLFITITIFGYSINIMHMSSSAVTRARYFFNISPLLLAICALAYIIPYLFIPALLNIKLRFKLLKYIILILAAPFLWLSSIIYNAIVFWGLIDFLSTEYIY